ncbi:MAG: hypothetical protein JWO95_1772 [Verrucomicrobiales bacterium]|nr:hypothetical protein [Verrucomicrobiales bacterium]
MIVCATVAFMGRGIGIRGLLVNGKAIALVGFFARVVAAPISFASSTLSQAGVRQLPRGPGQATARVRGIHVGASLRQLAPTNFFAANFPRPNRPSEPPAGLRRRLAGTSGPFAGLSTSFAGSKSAVRWPQRPVGWPQRVIRWLQPTVRWPQRAFRRAPQFLSKHLKTNSITIKIIKSYG